MRTRSRPLHALVLAVAALVMAGCSGGESGHMADAPASESGGESGARATTTTTTTPAETSVPVEAPDPPPLLQDASVALDRLAVDVDSPTDVQAVDGSLLVSEREGVVSELTPTGNGDYVRSSEVLDIRDLVGSTDAEKGLLGLTASSDYTRLYVNHTRADDGATVVAEYSLDGAAGSRTAANRRELVVLDQPFANHNAGGMAWGPDEMLWFGTGDGGSGGDPDGRAQRLSDPLGKLLRLDPTLPGTGEELAPADNPYVDDPDAYSLIWARGLRNPWRISFDDTTGDLWIADVGQNRFEEISVLRAGAELGRGADLGWDVFEGDEPFAEAGPDDDWPDDDAPLIAPLHTYTHDGRCSVTGGYLYRGAIAGLAGAYLFSDYCDGQVWGLASDGTAVDLDVSAPEVVSIDPDESGEAIVVASDGLYRLT
ncbi:MAG: PQQ-dependent sugar dehydrogenase [Microthrixaceae bacterium]